MHQAPLASWPRLSEEHDLLFWFGGFPVRVRPAFFLVVLLLGLPLWSLAAIAIWMLVAPVAVLLHECAHALLARRQGRSPQIELHSLGGETRWARAQEVEWSDRVLITLAGPLAGLVVGGIAWAVAPPLPGRAPSFLLLAADLFAWVNLGWGLFNLLPILPMDGGRVMAEFLVQAKGRDEGRLLSSFVSLGIAVVGCVLGLAVQRLWLALLCALFAYENLQRIRGKRGPDLVD